MTNEQNIINCTQFEELLTDYLDKTLEVSLNSAVGAHAMGCPVCHSLLNDVRQGLEACRVISEGIAPETHMTRLEARVLAMTVPEIGMTCEDFEGYLTEYLDGFLPAHSFHRWERHAALCSHCEDLPGMVVRSIGACLSYKMEELPVPAGLHDRILNMTLGTEHAEDVKASWASRAGEWIKGLRFPIGIPQLAPVAMMILFAFLVFSQTVSADGSLSGVYRQSVQLAESTYQQSADALKGQPVTTDTTPANPTN
jgi:anti-sigma factor RsiW